MADYELRAEGVFRRSDGAHIPAALGNRDWQKYQRWIDEGNIPDPMPVKPELTKAEKVRSQLETDPTLIALVSKLAKDAALTPQQMVDAITAEVK